MVRYDLFASAIIFLALSFSSFALDFERYHSQEEMNKYMEQLATDYPDIVQFKKLGVSAQNRDIYYVIISKSNPESIPGIYLNGTHHGDEKSSTETVLGVIDYLITNLETESVNELLSNYAIYLQPLVNPDGHANNTRTDSYGRDPNRDYAYPNRSIDNSFKVKEIDLVRSLLDKVKFRAATAYHSGMTGVLWPWCYTGQQSPDHDLFHKISKITAEAMNFSLYKQSYYDYQSLGEFIDYAYMAHKTLAITVEVSGASTPPASQLANVVKRAVTGTMTFMKAIFDLDMGFPELAPFVDQMNPLASVQ